MGIINFLNERFFGVLIPFLLIGTGIYLCVRLRFFHFLHPIRTARAMLKKENGAGGDSPLRALCMALAGTLGVGNITGVALAISAGGAGAVFWMWVSALAAMILRYSEIVLALDTRKCKNGAHEGSAMNYIKKGIGGRAGAAVAATFASLCLVCSFFLGGMVQSNVIGECFSQVMNVPLWVVGCVVSLLAFAVIMGGAKSISSICARIVPAMTLLFVVISLFAIIVRIEELPSVISEIFHDAFSADSALSGVGGFLFSRAVRVGVARGLISNEAGCGTAPIAHATSSAYHPSKQGLLGIFEVFVDTVLLCSLTAFVILLHCEDAILLGGDGMMIVIDAFSSVFGRLSGVIISVSVFFFAFATIICWAYYGQSCANYFHPRFRTLYSVVFCVALFFGAILIPDLVWGVTDILLSAMTLINVLVLIIMADRVVTLSAEFGLIKIKERECGRKAEHLRSKDVSPCH